MKVALDVSAAPARLAGAGRYIGELARRLPTAGVQTTLVTRRDDAARWEKWSPSSTIAPIVPSTRAARLVFEAWSLGTSGAARGSDVWHGPHYTMPRRGSTPTVVTIHDLTFFTDPQWHERSKVAFFKRAIAYSVAHADVLVSVSEFTARLLEELFDAHAPVVVAPHGVDLARFTPVGDDDQGVLCARGLASESPFILFVGTIEPRKGLDVLLDAFAVLARDDADVELWLAGQAGWGLAAFDAALGSHRAASRVRRLGFVDEEALAPLLRRARVVAYPSRGEGFGLPVLEAMACGAAVVTSRGTVMAEVAGDAALLVDAGDAHGLAVALRQVLDAPEPSRANRARAARARAELFTWDASMAQHLKAYDMARGRA